MLDPPLAPVVNLELRVLTGLGRGLVFGLVAFRVSVFLGSPMGRLLFRRLFRRLPLRATRQQRAHVVRLVDAIAR